MYRSEKLHYTTSTSNGLPPFQVDGATERGCYRDDDNKNAMAKDKIIFDFAHRVAARSHGMNFQKKVDEYWRHMNPTH